jgi:lauroyl/myristoyl acyltransferase
MGWFSPLCLTDIDAVWWCLWFGAVLVLHPLDMVSVALDHLGECVGSLAKKSQEITDALDELLTRP